ncbi:MAG: hypothetical protein L0322_30040, partial [Chloroflexi bacterium]|nr:hypothetical protein [Chloroflexota bacterium]
PGGEVDGVGYEEDQRWQHATVEAGQPSDWLVWMGIARPDIQIDGAFTAWPADANMLLKRTFGSYAGSPVMIEYPYGQGTVLATTAYGDWAWQTNFWWGDDARLTHSILIRAYLLARGQDVGDVFAGDPANSVGVSFPLKNSATFSATQAHLQIPLVWGTGSNSSVATVPLSLGSQEETTIAATMPTPPVMRGVHDWTQVGLYRVRVTVSTSDGGRYTTWGPFVYVRSPIVPPSLAGTLQTSRQPADLFATVAVSATVRNYTAVARTVTISDQVGLPAAPVVLTVPPNSTATQVYDIFMDGSKSLSVAFYDEGGELVGRSNMSVNVAYPDLRALPLIPAALGDGSVIPVEVTNQARQGQALAPSLAMTLTTPSGVPVWTETQALPPIAAGETVTPSFTLTGVVEELGTYQLEYRIDDGRNLSRVSSVPLPSRLTLETLFDRASYRIRESGELTLVVHNSGRFDLNPTVTVDGPAVSLADSQVIDLPANGEQSLIYPFAVPDTLPAGSHPVVVGYQVGSQTISRTLSVIVPPAAIRTSLADRSYAAGEVIVVDLDNRGGVDAPLATTLQLVDGRGQMIAENVVSATILAGASGVVTLDIPAGAATGQYQLVVDGEVTPTGLAFGLYETVDVSGVAAGLTVQTGQPAYFSDEAIEAQATLGVTSGALDNGNLNLRICSPTDPLGFDDPGGSGGTQTRTTYESEAAALNWGDISTTGMIVAVGDDTYSLVNLGFSFEFYGTAYTQAYIGSNGYITFGSGNTSFSNSAIPNPGTPNNAIYAFWDDLYPVGGVYGNVYARQVDASHYVVQWQTVTHCCSTGIPETFQVILDGSDNSITLQYLDVTSPGGSTVGVENADGSVATQIAFNQLGIIVDGAAFHLTPVEEEITLPAATFKSYVYTVGDVILFSYEDGSELALYRTDGTLIWQGTVNSGQRQLINVPTGTYLATGNKKFTILTGDPVSNGVTGYYAADQNGFGVSRELYTWTQRSFFPPHEFFIVFAYEDNTYVTVEDADTGVVYFTGTLNNGQHWQSNTLHQRWMHVTADKPVSAYTYYDQGSLVPAADGRWSGTLFYTYAGLVGFWRNDLNVMAFEDNTEVTVQNLDTGQVYWTGTLNNGQIHTEVFGGNTARGAAYLSVSSSRAVAVTVAPFVSFTGAYHMGFYAPDASGARLGTDLIAPMLSGGTMQVFAYHNDTVVQVFNSTTGAFINSYTLQAGQSVNANPGYGLWRLLSNKPISAWAGWGQASAEFAPVLFGSIVVGTPFDSNCGFVLWEENVPVTTTATLDVNELVDPLEVTGRLILDGRLFANTGQLLAHDDYPFYLFDRDTALTLETDREVYRPDQPIQASGLVTNTSALTANLTLELTDGSNTLLSQTLTLAPGEGYAYSTSLMYTSSVTLTATADNAETSLFVPVAEPQLAAELIAPDVVGRAPFSATLIVTNTGVVSAAVQTTVVDQAGPSLLLQPGEVAQVVKSTAITEDTTLTASISGDVSLALTRPVAQGELAALSLLSPDGEVAGLVEVPYLLEGTGSLPVSGQLLVEVDGLPALALDVAVPAGETVAGTLPLDLAGGRHTVSGQLVDQAGNEIAQDALEVALLEPAEPAIPQVSVQNVSVSPSPVAAGDTLVVTVELANDGAAGPIIVGLQLFDPEQQWIITPPAFATDSFTFELPVPADLPAGEYFGELTVDGASQPFTVLVAAAEVEMSLALDQAVYYPGDVATLTATFTEMAGVGGNYIVMPRYLVAEAYDPITIPANQTVQYTFAFTVTEAARANVFLATAGSPPDFDRRVLLLDSLPVPVVQPQQGAYLTFDKLVYDPGETIYGTLHVTGTLGSVVVMGPLELAYQTDGLLLWGPPSGESGLVVTGTYPFSYTLPAALREGRYTFVAQINGEAFTYPVDVRGWKVTTRHITLDQARYNQEDEISAVVEFWNEKDEPILGLELTAWIFTPDDGDVLTLTPAVSQPVDLLPGLNVFEISGAFSTPVVGPHRLLVNVGLPGVSWRVAGAAAQFDVGWAHLVELTTDHGSYTPGQPGTGRLDVYGYGPTQLTVTATGGATVLEEQVDLAGFSTFTFSIPTPAIGDYLLVAQSTDQDGNTDQLIRAYAVHGPADTLAPQISLTYPNTRTVITSASETTTIVVTGQASDDSGVVTVLVNGQVVTPTAGGDFSLPVELHQGFNLVSAVAVDAADNVAFTPLIPVLVTPAHGVTLSADQQQVQVGQPLVYTVVLSATGTISDVVMLDRLPAGRVTGLSSTANTGEATVNDDGLGVTWQGPVTAGQPAIVTIQVTPTTCGPLTNQVSALWGSGLVQDSNAVTVEVVGTTSASLYPIALHQAALDGIQVGQSLGDIFFGGGPGNFGWLSWTGESSSTTLATSLTPPGDSETYVNPNDPNDHEVSLADWVDGRPGLQNSQAVRDALDLLVGSPILIPVWDTATGSGNNTLYHVTGFALVEITGYELTSSVNRISAVYLGTGAASCDAPNP